jgi:alkylation response protein AidB-like acyl-CoA dehydrogenase
MDFDFPPDTVMLRDMLRRFIQKEARPLEMKYFTSGELEDKERARLRQAIEQMGLWGLTAPEAFGGGIDTVSACLIEEELGKTFIPLEIGEVPAPLYACSDEQVARFLEPALAGERRAIIAAREPVSDGYRPESWTTSAAPENGNYRLNGFKSLGKAPEPGDFFIVYARTPDGLSAFLIDFESQGLQFNRRPGMTLEINGCIANPEALLGESGSALALGAEEAPRAWIRMGARYVGIVERLIEMAGDHARDWISLGEALAVRPAIREMLASMRVDVESSRWLVYHAAWMADSNPSGDLRIPAAQVRLATGEMLLRAVDRSTMLFAGPGPSPQIEPQRLVRDLVPDDVLQLALQQARAAIAAHELNLTE